MMTLMSTCEAVLIAKNEEIDALKRTIQLKDEALAEKNTLIHELATLLAIHETNVARAMHTLGEDCRHDVEACRPDRGASAEETDNLTLYRREDANNTQFSTPTEARQGSKQGGEPIDTPILVDTPLPKSRR